MKNILIIIVLAFQFLSCNEEIINPANSENNEIRHSLSGNISESSNPIDSVQVIVNDSLSTLSNENGYFKIDSLLSGSYLITFRCNRYKEKDTTLVLKSDATLVINLHKVYNNYFPIAVDSQYYFKYKRTFHWTGSPFLINEICSLHWDVINSETENDSTVFYINEYLSGERIEHGINDDGTYYIDTTEISGQYKFSIIQRNDTLIFRQEYLPSIWAFGSVKIKYIRNSSDDLITDKYQTRVITLQKQKGIIYYYDRSVGGNNWNEVELNRYYE